MILWGRILNYEYNHLMLFPGLRNHLFCSCGAGALFKGSQSCIRLFPCFGEFCCQWLHHPSKHGSGSGAFIRSGFQSRWPVLISPFQGKGSIQGSNPRSVLLGMYTFLRRPWLPFSFAGWNRYAPSAFPCRPDLFLLTQSLPAPQRRLHWGGWLSWKCSGFYWLASQAWIQQLLSSI